MKRIALVTAVFVVLAAQSLAALAAETQWSPYEQGIRQGRRSGKHVLINFYTDNCRWCDRMFQNTYTDRGVADFLNRYFVSVKVDGNQERNLKREYGIMGYPTIWFIDPKGEKIAFIPGFVPPDEFLAALKYIQTQAYDEMSFEDFLERGLDRLQ